MSEELVGSGVILIKEPSIELMTYEDKNPDSGNIYPSGEVITHELNNDPIFPDVVGIVVSITGELPAEQIPKIGALALIFTGVGADMKKMK